MNKGAAGAGLGARFDFDDVYIVSELMDTDLHKVIYSKQRLSVEHIQYFIYQTLRALKYIHSANVIHRDLKPSNLLVNGNCDLKICDFGLTRFTHEIPMPAGGRKRSQEECRGAGCYGASQRTSHYKSREQDKCLTEYVVTRWYRAPEVMLSCRQYDKKIDTWSVGCILAELLLRKPLFPGDDYINQLQLIVEMLGKPLQKDLDFVASKKAMKFMLAQKDSDGSMFYDLFANCENATASGIDLLKRLLSVNPRKRLSAEQALRHPFFKALHAEKDEPRFGEGCHYEVDEKVKQFFGDFSIDFVEERDLTKKMIQQEVLKEVSQFHTEAKELLAENTVFGP